MNQDMELAFGYMRGLLQDFDTEEFVFFTHEGAPVSKSRARWSQKQRRFYTPTDTISAEQALAKRFMTAIPKRPWEGNVAVAAIFFRPNRQRIDADNLMKLVLDAGTKAGAWRDDSQVTRQLSIIELDAVRPRTLVTVARVDSTLNRFRMVTFTCQECGKEFERDRTTLAGHVVSHCSDACRYAKQRALVRCAKCDVEFKRNTAGQRYCSKSCASSANMVRRVAALQRPWPICACGKRVSRREYLRCMECAKADRRNKVTERMVG